MERNCERGEENKKLVHNFHRVTIVGIGIQSQR